MPKEDGQSKVTGGLPHSFKESMSLSISIISNYPLYKNVCQEIPFRKHQLKNTLLCEILFAGWSVKKLLNIELFNGPYK